VGLLAVDIKYWNLISIKIVLLCKCISAVYICKCKSLTEIGTYEVCTKYYASKVSYEASM